MPVYVNVCNHNFLHVNLGSISLPILHICPDTVCFCPVHHNSKSNPKPHCRALSLPSDCHAGPSNFRTLMILQAVNARRRKVYFSLLFSSFPTAVKSKSKCYTFYRFPVKWATGELTIEVENVYILWWVFPVLPSSYCVTGTHCLGWRGWG